MGYRVSGESQGIGVSPWRLCGWHDPTPRSSEFDRAGIVDDLDWDCHASRKGVRGHDLVRRREEYSAAAVVIQQG